MPSQLILIGVRVDPEGKGINMPAIIQEPDNTHKLRVKGFINFEVINTGTVSIFLWENVEILPTESWAPPATFCNLPFNDDIPLRWADDYEHTKNIADVTEPVPSVIPA